ncbi:MAG TPA: 2-hydroxyhepta-2,4-diene-1,7-dioate isomerase, partial [Ramlibacter sp.]|nr:2-hydroxyhepta-2,4-diene-1,7-dioate isomerase [Ramlibacter sp.]
MKRARVMVDGVVHAATERDGQVVLEDGRRLWQDQVRWLPPLMPLERPRTILALGLNYRDHAKEL